MKLLDIFNEIRYINPKYPQIDKESPIFDKETIRVYHGFNSFNDVEEIMKNGLSGKEKAKRIYSYESGNNPHGLFVTIDFDRAKQFTHSGVIIEFSSKISDLEAPVWVGGRSYFVQGEYTKSFKDLSDREKQRLINRNEASKHDWDVINKSDRPELAYTIFENPERQALFVGDLNPNMIKYVWYNEVLHKERRTNGEWKRYKRIDFIKKLNINIERNRWSNFYPNDDFTIEKIKNAFEYENYGFKKEQFIRFIKRYLIDSNEYELKNIGLYPKQIQQVKDLRTNGFFEKYLNTLEKM